MKLAVFHYHLKRGGVTTVILQSIQALYAEAQHFAQVEIVSGSEEHTDQLRAQLPQGVTIRTVAELGYVEGLVTDIENRDETEPLYRRLRAMLEEDYGDYTWWVHNYHLGKNPFFTKALVDTLADNPSQPALLTIHDFPEDGRYPLLDRCRRVAGDDLYPAHPATHYHLINSHDARRLAGAGVPSTHLHYIPNPVDARTADTPTQDPLELRRKLEQAFASSFPSYRKGAPYLLYPVRSIRRKNVLEALLIASLMEENVLVTLPGTSAQEAPYSRLVEQAYRDRLVPGMWGMGNDLDAHGLSFPDVIAAAQALVSSSVQEGFGYQYLTALTAQKPLVARKIAVMDDMLFLLERHAHKLYAAFKIGVSRVRCSDLSSVYRKRLAAASFPQRVAEHLEEHIAEMERSQRVDFFLLELSEQYRYLSSSTRRRGLAEEHRAFIDSCRDCIYDQRRGNVEEVAKAFGPSSFARAFKDMLRSVDQRVPQRRTVSAEAISEALAASFADLKSLSFLLH